MFDAQADYDARCDWGGEGLRRLAPDADVVAIVDVLSFATAVDIAVGRGALVYPFGRRGSEAEAYARQVVAELASSREPGDGYSLSPHSLLTIPQGTCLVLPSPNGATLTLAAAEQYPVVLVGCLRNAVAVAATCRAVGGTVAVIAAGEVWRRGDRGAGTLRFAVEDLVGAGAILSALAPGRPSPEAVAAMGAFAAARPRLARFLADCASGRELIERGYAADVVLAAALDVSDTVPTWRDGILVPWTAA